MTSTTTDYDAVVVGAGITASVSGGGSEQEVRAACRTLGYDVASVAGGADDLGG